MVLNVDFFTHVEGLRVPVMGTDSIAPLLYSLLRWLRVRRVLEIGIGYTTPFIAQALHDNMLDFSKEQGKLLQKLARWADGQDGPRLDAKPPFTSLEEDWLAEDPPLVRPTYYQGHFKPILHAIDDFSSPQSSAPKVAEVLKQLNLLSMVEIHNGDYHQARSKFDSNTEVFDLIWVDCDQSIFIFDDYWDLLKSPNGLFVIHSLLSDKGGDITLRYFLDTIALSGGSIEVLNLFEPQKLYQSGVTILRRLS